MKGYLFAALRVASATTALIVLALWLTSVRASVGVVWYQYDPSNALFTSTFLEAGDGSLWFNRYFSPARSRFNFTSRVAWRWRDPKPHPRGSDEFLGIRLGLGRDSAHRTDFEQRVFDIKLPCWLAFCLAGVGPLLSLALRRHHRRGRGFSVTDGDGNTKAPFDSGETNCVTSGRQAKPLI